MERFKDSTISEVFQATIGGKFAPLFLLEEDAKTLITKFNHWITNDILRDLKKKTKLKNTKKGAVEYREISKRIRSEMKKAKEEWIEEQCSDIEDSLNKNNSRRVFQIVKELMQPRQSKVSTIQDKEGKCHADKQATV